MIYWRRFFIFLVLSVFVSIIIIQIVLTVVLKPILAREAERIFQVPVSIDKAGANLFTGQVWIKDIRVKNPSGFEETYFLKARTISFDLSFLSLLTREFSVSQISLKDPQFIFEVNKQGQRNEAYFMARALEQFEQFMNKKPRFVYVATSYLLGKFSIRNGVIQQINRLDERRNWVLKSVSFSLARIIYPPDPEEALPAAVYLNSVMPGAKEGKLLLLGRLNPFVEKKSFDITGSVKNLGFEQMSHFMPDFPLTFVDGVFQIKIKAVCHENQVDVHEQVRMEGLKFKAKTLVDKRAPLVFGLPQQTVIRFFNDLQPATEPFEFEFHILGDLSNPRFNLFDAVIQKTQRAIYDRITNRLKLLQEEANIDEEAIGEFKKAVSPRSVI